VKLRALALVGLAAAIPAAAAVLSAGRSPRPKPLAVPSPQFAPSIDNELTGTWYKPDPLFRDARCWRVEGFNVNGRKFYVLVLPDGTSVRPQLSPAGAPIYAHIAPDSSTGSFLDGTAFTTTVHRSLVRRDGPAPPDLHYRIDTVTPGRLLCTVSNEALPPYPAHRFEFELTREKPQDAPSIDDELTGAWYDQGGSRWRVEGFDVKGRKFYILVLGDGPIARPPWPALHPFSGPGISSGSPLEGAVFTTTILRSWMPRGSVEWDTFLLVDTATPGKLVVSATAEPLRWSTTSWSTFELTRDKPTAPGKIPAPMPATAAGAGSEPPERRALLFAPAWEGEWEQVRAEFAKRETVSMREYWGGYNRFIFEKKSLNPDVPNLKVTFVQDSQGYHLDHASLKELRD